MTTRARKIVVGYDGSESSRRALDAAADLAGYGSTLSVVTVQTPEVNGSAAREARTRLQARHLEARYHQPVGEPAEQLLEKAAELEADVIVVGRRNGGPLDTLLGSVSSRVAGGASCDVLVVR